MSRHHSGPDTFPAMGRSDSDTLSQEPGGGAAALVFEWKETGGSYVEIEDGGTAMPTNLSGKQLILAVTPSSGVELETVATDLPNLLAENGDATGTLTPSVQNEIAFDMAVDKLAGIAVVTVTIDGTDYTFTFHCYQYAGSLRAVNTGPTASSGIVVNGVTLPDADAGHASLADAHTAASDGDAIVPDEAFEDSTNVTFTKEVIVDCADSVRGLKTSAGVTSGFYTSGQVAFQSANVIYRNCNFSHTGFGTAILFQDFAVATDATFILEGVAGYKTGSFQGIASSPSSGNNIVGTIRNVIVYADGTGGSGIVLNGDTTTLTLENVTVYGLPACTGKGIWNNSTGGTMVLKNCVSLGTFGAAGWDYLTNGGSFNTGDNNVGNTGGGVASACATTSYTTTAAAYFKSTTASAEDAHCVSAAVNDDFAGLDLSGSFDADIDGEKRTANYAGADFVSS